jgi:hypothetical protein
MLIRWFVPFYLAVPVLYVLYLSLWRDRAFKQVLPRFIAGSLLFLVLCLPWYLANYKMLRIVSAFFAQGEKDDPQILLSLENITYYLKNIVGFQILLVPFLLSIFGTFKLFKVDRRAGILAVVEILLIYATFTIIKNKNSRYTLGILPVLAFLTAYGFSFLNNKALKVLVIGFCLTGLFYTSFNSVSVRSVESKAWGLLLTGPFYDNLYIYPHAFTYRNSDADVKQILTNVYSQSLKTNIKPVGVASGVDSEDVSAANLELARIYLGYEDMFFATPYFRERPFESDYELIKYLRDRGVSYLINGDYAGPDNLRHYKLLVQMNEFAKLQGAYWFDKTSTYNYTDNEIRIFLRKTFNQDFPVDTCKTVDTQNGSISLQADPLASFVVFTPSFEYNGVVRSYEPQTTRILELNNFDTTPKAFSVGNLPAQVSTCHRMGTQIKLVKEIAQALTDKNSYCGNNLCSYLVHTKMNAADGLEDKRYTKNYFEGEGLEKLLKRAKILPYYQEYYSVKKDIMDELAK